MANLGTIHILRKHLKGGKVGGSGNANFCLFSVLKICLGRGGGGAKNPKNVLT